MFISFLSEREHHSQSITIPQIYQVRRLYAVNAAKLTEYHRTKRFYLDERNIIKRLLKTLDVSGDRNLQSYVDSARESVGHLSRLFGLSSSTNTGRATTDSNFLNKKVSEIIILHGEHFDVETASQNWKELEPVKFLDHPHTDLSYGLPAGQYLSNESGAAIISINLPMLAMQYRLWAQQELLHTDPLKISTFVTGYPLNNAMRSHMDIAIFNRLMNYMNDSSNLNKPKNKATSIAMPDLTPSVDAILAAYANAIRRKRMAFHEILHTIPTLTTDNFSYRAKLPEMPITDQAAWAVYGSTIKKLCFLFRLNVELDLALNRDVYNEVKWITRKLNNDRVLQLGYPAELYELFTELQNHLDLAM